ncbi:MAG: type II toxin-antitoxin system RelE/ParE family toxin [Acetobacteraceae bacterium]
MRLFVTPTFSRAAKKLHRGQKAELDNAVRAIVEDPTRSEAKVGDLAGVRVFKFRLANHLCLLAFTQIDEETIKLLALGSHENFYKDLKRT